MWIAKCHDAKRRVMTLWCAVIVFPVRTRAACSGVLCPVQMHEQHSYATSVAMWPHVGEHGPAGGQHARYVSYVTGMIPVQRSRFFYPISRNHPWKFVVLTVPGQTRDCRGRALAKPVPGGAARVDIDTVLLRYPFVWHESFPEIEAA